MGLHFNFSNLYSAISNRHGLKVHYRAQGLMVRCVCVCVCAYDTLAGHPINVLSVSSGTALKISPSSGRLK